MYIARDTWIQCIRSYIASVNFHVHVHVLLISHLKTCTRTIRVSLTAADYLQFAFDNCYITSRNNKRLVLHHRNWPTLTFRIFYYIRFCVVAMVVFLLSEQVDPDLSHSSQDAAGQPLQLPDSLIASFHLPIHITYMHMCTCVYRIAPGQTVVLFHM